MKMEGGKLEGKCDICTKPDGSRDHNLQQCKECKVLVHELCYGMVPTQTKDPNFVCHACKAIGEEIEVNVPSKLGGMELRDVLASKEGIASLREYICADGNGGDGTSQNKLLDFYAAVSEFQRNESENENGDGCKNGGESIKTRAQHIFDNYCANDAEQKVNISPDILAGIDTKIFSNNDGKDSIISSIFEEARKEILQLLEKTSLFKKYKQSASFKAHLARQRIRIKQEERPMECVLCSVKHGTHAMHPLYDNHGKEARQLLLPASGAGFRRKEAHLAWVHTLCAMFICSSDRTRGLTYGCDADGEYETNEDEEEEDDAAAAKDRIINSDDECEESLEEQRNFTKCEDVFLPLMNVLEDAKERDSSKNDISGILKCIDSMIENVEYLTPSFVHEYQIGQLVRCIRKTYEGTHPEVKARCKVLTAAMKRVYNEKENMVPEGFVPVKNAKSDDAGEVTDQFRNGNSAGEANDTDVQKYEVGTTVVKEFRHGTYSGEITNYDASEKLYRILYSDGDSEDLTESEVSALLLTYTAWFCIASKKDGELGERIKSHQELICFVCKKKDNATKNCLRIPVQCSAGDPYEFKEFKGFHHTLNKRKLWAKKQGDDSGPITCATAMHVGCARWGVSEYAKVNNRDLRMCYYFSGKPPTYTGPDDYVNPVSNCFCRPHAREIQEGLQKMNSSAGTGPHRKRKGTDSTSELESEEDPDDKEKRQKDAIARKKKKLRILEESEEESD